MCLVLHARFYYWNGRMSSLVTRVNRRILVIGDTPSVREIVRKALGLAANAKDGLASAEEALFGSAAVAFIDSASRDPVSATTLRISSVSPVGIGMTVEGVETQEQQTSLISAGLPMNAQGYCFKAVSGQHAAQLLMVMAGSIVPPPATDTLAIENSHRPVEVARWPHR
jgi:hypothetical protein